MNLNTEWQSPNFHGLGAMRFELFILILPLLVAISKRRPSLTALAISVLWLHFALNGQRYVALWVIVTVPLVARLSIDLPWWKTWSAKWKLSPEFANMLSARPRSAGWGVSFVAALALLGWARLSDGYSYHADKNIPVQALETLIDHADDQVVFNHYNWGGWIVWHGWPNVRNWIDDRNEVHGRRHIEEYFRLIGAEGEWQKRLDAYEIGLVCIPPDAPLARRLAAANDWRELYRDSHAVVFESPARRRPLSSIVSAGATQRP
jgi:hypothetical protein